ncbi:MAG TPA: ATP-binding protein [Candidatus Dietzia intestinigallinarum]|nr:ATP-binding protein [Candidatus Dietzia intestinigallinarum]
MQREHNCTGHVVWINGAFGSGKTTTAQLLVNAVPGSVLVDPEEVGTLLRDVLQPVAPVRDFQQWGAWRELVAATLNSVVRELPEVGPGLVVVPQTISNDEYWSEIVSALDPGCRITAVALQVSADEHRRRVAEDTSEPGALRWRLGGFEQFRSASWITTAFTCIETTDLGPAEVADAVRALLSDEIG